MFAKSWLLLFFLSFFSGWVNAEKSQTVLLLHSYHPQYAWTQKLTLGVQEALAHHIQTENLHIEFMDERRYQIDPSIGQVFIALLQRKYQHQQPDVIITSDDHAYYFMLEQGERLFPGVPVIFCGVNVFNPNSLTGKSNFTGIKEGMEIEGNLDLIMSVQPSTQHIIMLGDTTGLGLRMVQRAKHIKSRWVKQHQHVNLSIWDDFTLDELYQRVAQLPANTALLMLAIHQDKNEQYFSFNNELPILSARSSAPIFGMWGEILLNYGVVGGKMNNPYQHGFQTAQIALKVLSGTAISQLPIQEKAQYTPQFDYTQMLRFGINLDAIPSDSVLINRPEGLFEKLQKWLKGDTGLVSMLLLVAVLVFINGALRRNNKDRWAKFKASMQKRSRQLKKENKVLQATSRKMEKLAHTDDLTGLANRRAGESEINAYIRRFRINDQPLSLALLDIDKFKRINDTYGHPVGDVVLCALGAALTKLLRPGDRIYRWGGEEFLISLPHTSVLDAREVCERIRKCVSELVVGDIPPESGIHITASLGLSDFQQGDSLDGILQRCDEALYMAKHNGRNQLVVG